MPVMASHDAGWALICIDCAGSAGNYRQNWERFFWGGFEGGLLVDARAFAGTNARRCQVHSLALAGKWKGTASTVAPSRKCSLVVTFC